MTVNLTESQAINLLCRIFGPARYRDRIEALRETGDALLADIARGGFTKSVDTAKRAFDVALVTLVDAANEAVQNDPEHRK